MNATTSGELCHPAPALEHHAIEPRDRPAWRRDQSTRGIAPCLRAVHQKRLRLFVRPEDDVGQWNAEEAGDVEIALVVRVMAQMKPIEPAPHTTEYRLVEPASPVRLETAGGGGMRCLGEEGRD